MNINVQDLFVCGKTIARIGNIQYVSAFGYIYKITWNDKNEVEKVE